MRLLVSWIVSRIAFIPSMVLRTASPPLCAMSTEWRATSALRSEFPAPEFESAAESAARHREGWQRLKETVKPSYMVDMR